MDFFPASFLARLSRGYVTGLKSIVVLVLAFAVSGCVSYQLHPIYTPTGMVIAAYSEAQATPYVMAMDDPGMACRLGEGVDPLVYSFSRVSPAPDSTGSLLMLLSALCSEREARQAELEYLLAEYNGEVSVAKDARERSKRLYAVTATRRYKAFQRAMSAYGFDPAADPIECPSFSNDQAELTFLLGLITGLQAIVSDSNSGARAGIPKDIAPQAARATKCVDNEKWGGAPAAVRANIWLLLPDSRPPGAPEPWALLDKSSKQGIEAGNRLSLALEAVAAETFGRRDILKKVIAEFVEADDTIEIWEEYQLSDEVAREVIQFSSDKYWIANYGYRTPASRFGSLDEHAESDAKAMDLDDLL
ncbi:hypothetical protein [Hydrocarboniclastica marina]|uniref:Uncharacterized protein n=1 Tax=Hydrocarboniclastica marina TaxID=2259620 RepID=A0A4P7XI87_9ALTE|nr:hypothetical protein [Hydrocarboniclastica marina]QCF26799.1 hypothetical protein soil367_13135 [Hydrocarboniclastica marina]